VKEDNSGSDRCGVSERGVESCWFLFQNIFLLNFFPVLLKKDLALFFDYFRYLLFGLGFIIHSFIRFIHPSAHSFPPFHVRVCVCGKKA